MYKHVCSLLFLLALLTASAQAADLTVTFVSCGQGDAALIVSPTGKTVLVDGGPPEGTERLLQVLKKRQVSSIDLVILSHPHLDHLGGLGQVAKSMPVRMFLDAGFPSTSPPYNNLLRVLAERGVAVKNATLGRNIDLGDGLNWQLGVRSSYYFSRRLRFVATFNHERLNADAAHSPLVEQRAVRAYFGGFAYSF